MFAAVTDVTDDYQAGVNAEAHLQSLCSFLLPLWGKVRMGGRQDPGTNGDPLTLSLSRGGRGNLYSMGKECQPNPSLLRFSYY